MKTLPLDAELRARLRELLEVDPTSPSGLRWKVRRGPAPAGSQAGYLNRSTDYWHVKVEGKIYQAHRLIWALDHDEDPGDSEIDHIDGKRGNNAPSNLRLATHGENRRNGGLPCNNTSGHKGVRRRSDRTSWEGLVELHGKRITKLFSDSKQGGTTAALAAAAKWVRTQREELHGEFARHG